MPIELVLYSVGIGPGDPELITVKAVKVLKNSDKVIVPQSDIEGRSIARDIILHYIDESKVMMYHIPMTKNRKELQHRYTELACIIKNLLNDKKKISYVTMGDPTIYSTSNYLTKRLKELSIKVIHIPGISAVNAASSLLGVPLCLKGENFGVYEMPSNAFKTQELIKRHPTVVFMKVNKRLNILKKALKKVKPVKAYFLRRIGLEEEEIIDLTVNEISNADDYMSLALVRKIIK